MERVLLGMSGGIDSSVSALILKEQGYDVVGIHLVVQQKEEDKIKKLLHIGKKIGIPIDIVDKSDEFEKTVIAYFKNELQIGRSPSPCAICNPEFKWKVMLDYANEHKIPFIASGHYIQKEWWQNKWWLRKGVDELKDQSYFLWGLNQEVISRMILPLGSMNKSATRQIAVQKGLGFLLHQNESTGLCFAGELSYGKLVKQYMHETEILPGEVINKLGQVIGKHKGYIYYTIGQKRELEFFDGIGRTVIAINAASNQIVAGADKDLWRNSFTITNYRFVDEDLAFNSSEISTKIRGIGRNPGRFVKLTQADNGVIRIDTDEPVWAAAPGQPAVFYYKDFLLGGGFVV